MDRTALAKYMLQWEETQNKADELRVAIQDAVFELKETQQAGNVRAVYSEGRKTYSYEDVGSDASPDIVEKHTKTTTTTRTDWRKIVEEMNVPKDVIPFSQGKPSAKLKIV